MEGKSSLVAPSMTVITVIFQKDREHQASSGTVSAPTLSGPFLRAPLNSHLLHQEGVETGVCQGLSGKGSDYCLNFSVDNSRGRPGNVPSTRCMYLTLLTELLKMAERVRFLLDDYHNGRKKLGKGLDSPDQRISAFRVESTPKTSRWHGTASAGPKK